MQLAMRPDKLAYAILRSMKEAQTMGTRIDPVENFCDGIVEIDGPVNLIEVAKKMLVRLNVEEIAPKTES